MEVKNQEIKNIVKKIVWPNVNDWAAKLLNALWAYPKTYKMSISMSPYRLVFGKAFHLPIELDEIRKEKVPQLKEIKELRNET